MRDWSRRDFLAALAASGAALAWPTGRRAFGATPIGRTGYRVGFIGPSSGPLAVVGEAAARGAELGAAEVGRLAELFDSSFELVFAEAGDPASVEHEARRLVEEDDVFAIVGGLDEPSCLALGEVTDGLDVLFFNVGCAASSLRGEACRRNTFSVEASMPMYADALAHWLVQEEGLRRWAFLTPTGTAAPEGYADTRAAVLDRGGEEIERVQVDPQAGDAAAALRRLGGSDADAVFLALDAPARTPFLTAYNALGEPGFELAGPPISAAWLWNLPSAARVGVWPTLWHHKLFKYGSEQLGDRFGDRFEQPLDARAWASWMAVKILGETIFRVRETGAAELVRFLEGERAQFDGHKGKRLTFRHWNHQLRQPVYLVRGVSAAEGRWDAFQHVAELPLGEPSSRRTSSEFLDQLGEGEKESICQFATA